MFGKKNPFQGLGTPEALKELRKQHDYDSMIYERYGTIDPPMPKGPFVSMDVEMVDDPDYPESPFDLHCFYCGDPIEPEDGKFCSQGCENRYIELPES